MMVRPGATVFRTIDAVCSTGRARRPGGPLGVSGPGDRRFPRQSDRASRSEALRRTGRTLSLALLLSVTACAGAHLGPVAEMPDPAGAAPLVLEVDRVASAPVCDQSGSDLSRTSNACGTAGTPTGRDTVAINLAALEQQLQKKLHEGGIEAAVRTSGPLPPGDLSLLVHLQKVEDGNGWYRDLIGFGLGQSRLFAHVQLDDPRLAVPNQLLSFDVKANSGSTPGLLLSGGPVGAAVKGARIATREMTNDGHRNADYAAGAIARRIEEYYKKRGWIQTANNAKS